jgi:hypothetical protein
VPIATLLRVFGLNPQVLERVTGSLLIAELLYTGIAFAICYGLAALSRRRSKVPRSRRKNWFHMVAAPRAV